ncbi:RNA recognition motif domain [Dillenia turbinata]|uniref:RNA recognition motif domain n=1 Tax=Dillenia turbinata TaxID=194707 RepID=A0AAN8ZFT6_9MAGN
MNARVEMEMCTLKRVKQTPGRKSFPNSGVRRKYTRPDTGREVAAIASRKLGSCLFYPAELLSQKMEKSKHYGYVRFDSETSAQNAIQKLNGYKVYGKALYVLCSEGPKDVDR